MEYLFVMKNKIQKKRTTARLVLSTLFKISIIIALIIFAYILYSLYSKTNFSNNSIIFTSKKKTPNRTHTPSALKWHDDFKGIDNMSNEKEKKKQKGSSSGFSYEGFNK